MSVYVEEFVLDFNERILIRKALIGMAYQAGVSACDASVLKRLESQLSEANQVVLKGVYFDFSEDPESLP